MNRGKKQKLPPHPQKLSLTSLRSVSLSFCFLPLREGGFLAALVFLVFCVCHVAAAAPAPESDLPAAASGLPLPRFASLSADEVNMRTGPGTRYPIEWILTKRGMPVEIVAEYEAWRRVRDPGGDEGWVFRAGLSGARMAITTGGAHDLLSGEDGGAAVVAHLNAGAIGRLLECDAGFCKLRFKNGDAAVEGWLPKADFWGALPGERFD